MTTTLIQEEIPIFEFFSEIDKENDSGEKILSGINPVGRSSSVEELLSLFPASNVHVEFEDIEGKEEIRVIHSLTGDYHFLDSQEAKEAIEKVKEESRKLFSNAEEIHPGFGFNHHDPFWTNIIIFDEDSFRTLPVLKRIPNRITSIESFNSLKERPHAEPIIHDDFTGITFHRTGEFWLCTEGVKDKAVKELEESFIVNREQE